LFFGTAKVLKKYDAAADAFNSPGEGKPDKGSNKANKQNQQRHLQAS
jgi:hypothetical protein